MSGNKWYYSFPQKDYTSRRKKRDLTFPVIISLIAILELLSGYIFFFWRP